MAIEARRFVVAVLALRVDVIVELDGECAGAANSAPTQNIGTFALCDITATSEPRGENSGAAAYIMQDPALNLFPLLVEKPQPIPVMITLEVIYASLVDIVGMNGALHRILVDYSAYAMCTHQRPRLTQAPIPSHMRSPTYAVVTPAMEEAADAWLANELDKQRYFSDCDPPFTLRGFNQVPPHPSASFHKANVSAFVEAEVRNQELPYHPWYERVLRVTGHCGPVLDRIIHTTAHANPERLGRAAAHCARTYFRPVRTRGITVQTALVDVSRLMSLPLNEEALAIATTMLGSIWKNTKRCAPLAIDEVEAPTEPMSAEVAALCEHIAAFDHPEFPGFVAAKRAAESLLTRPCKSRKSPQTFTAALVEIIRITNRAKRNTRAKEHREKK